MRWEGEGGIEIDQHSTANHQVSRQVTTSRFHAKIDKKPRIIFACLKRLDAVTCFQ